MTRTANLAAPRRLAPLCAAACVLLGMQAARADDEANPYSLGVLETVTHDSNVFRAPPGPEVVADSFSTTGIIGSIDQQISRHHLHGNGEFDLNRFRNQTQLNSSAHSLSIQDDWTTIDRLAGELGYSDSSQLYRYAVNSDQPQTDKNTLHSRFGFARFHLGVVTRLTFDLGFEGYRQDYSADNPTYRARELNRRNGSFGLTWASSPDLRTSLSFKRTTGKYPHYLVRVPVVVDGQAGYMLDEEPDNFARNDITLGIAYNASGASRFRLNVSSATERHSQLQSRGMHTWAADGSWTWTPTGRTQLTLDFVRDNDTGSQSVATNAGLIDSADATKRTTVTGKIAYQLTGKVSLDASGSYAHRDLDTAFAGSSAGQGGNGEDKLYRASLGIDYAATRAIQLGCNFAREKRTVQGLAGNFVTYPYNDTLYSCTGQFVFN